MRQHNRFIRSMSLKVVRRLTPAASSSSSSFSHAPFTSRPYQTQQFLQSLTCEPASSAPHDGGVSHVTGRLVHAKAYTNSDGRPKSETRVPSPVDDEFISNALTDSSSYTQSTSTETTPTLRDDPTPLISPVSHSARSDATNSRRPASAGGDSADADEPSVTLPDGSIALPSKKKREPGQSCHQCKTRRTDADLYFCGTARKKKGRSRKRKERTHLP